MQELIFNKDKNRAGSLLLIEVESNASGIEAAGTRKHSSTLVATTLIRFTILHPSFGYKQGARQ